MYIGVDLGTSGVKTVIIDAEQQVQATSRVALSVSQPQPLWSEQDPADWWRALCQSFDQLQQQHPSLLAQVQAIGLAGQMHGATLLDKAGQVLRPAILWNDGRAYAECDALLERCPAWIEITGNLLMPGFTAPKLAWVQKYEPAVFKKIHKVLLPKDYLRYRLTGDYATDLSDASGTAWVDVSKRQWSERLLTATDLDIDNMPDLYEGTDVTSELRPELAKRWGMPDGVKLVGGAGDNAAGAVAMGVVKPGRAMLSLGTSGVYFTATDHFEPKPDRGLHAYCHCLPDTWHQMGVILSAASCLTWWQQASHATDHQQIIQAATKADPRYVPLFLPYLSGERTPHNAPLAKANFIGMTHNTGFAEFSQAVLEGVAFAIADCQQVLQAAHSDVHGISVIGGGAKSDYWGRIMADVLNKPLYYHLEAQEGPAYGAARLAMCAGQKALDIDLLAAVPPVRQTIEPDAKKSLYYQQRWQHYQESYRCLAKLLPSLNQEG